MQKETNSKSVESNMATTTNNNNTNLSNTKNMMSNNRQSAGMSRPAANMANIGNNIDEQSLDYLNEKVDTKIDGIPYPFRVYRWMMDIATHCGTKAQQTAFARLTGIGYHWDNFKGYALRLQVDKNEPKMLKKDIRHIKGLVNIVRNSDVPYAENFIASMNDLIDGFTGLLNDCAGKNRSVA